MNFNSFLFPAPQSSYSMESFMGDIVYIPKNRTADQKKRDRELIQEMKDKPMGSEVACDNLPEEEKKKEIPSTIVQKTNSKKINHIPCLYLPYSQGSSKVLIYFHGNAEDIGLAYELLDHLRNTLRIHVIGMEFCGYGIYEGSPTADKVSQDANTLFDYLTEDLKVDSKDIFLFGRSMGTGPATDLAANKNAGALLLMSAYTSIRGVVKSLAGKYLQFVVAERFTNLELMQKVTCPTFFVHGQKDKLIPFTHSQELHSKCSGPTALILPSDMDHNEFDFFEDLSQPFYFFLMQCGISVAPEDEKDRFLRFPEHFYIPPDNFPKKRSSTLTSKILHKFS